MDLHNTAIKKNSSFIFETNAEDKAIDTVNENIQPTVEVQPYIDIVRSRDTTGTFYTTPTDKNFYLTGYSFSAGNSAGDGMAYSSITFTLRDGTQVSSAVVVGDASGVGALNGNNNYTAETFPMRGILLAKGSAITLTVDASHTCVGLISGYLDSDRSG